MLMKVNSITVPVSAFARKNGKLMTQKDAKTLLNNVISGDRITFDFHGITQIGQAFAHEIFYVFNLNKPNIELVTVNACGSVESVIKRAISTMHDCV